MYTGKKIKLRAYSIEDAEQAQKYINNPNIKQYLTPGVPFPLTLTEERKWMENISSSSDSYSFAIETLEDGKYIGGCGINELDWKNSVATVGIFIGDEDYHNKGYGTDAMKTLLSFIFNEMNIHKVRLDVYSFNPRAIKSYEKAGFKKEGILRQEIFRKGSYHDKIIMGIVREEFLL